MKKDQKFLIVNIIIALGLTYAGYLVGLSVRDTSLLPDLGPAWYYWKLPNPTLLSRLSAWVLYLGHQGAVWYLVIRLMRDKNTHQPIRGGLRPINKWLFIINGIFIGLHMIQTFLFYDGLAQDVSVASSQYSVIIMLVLILIMENRRRGLFFGKKVPLPTRGLNRIQKYHGIYIAWAITYTFWYHPLIATPGHLFGFFYMYLLFIQLSLSGTKYHMNRLWTFILEVTVLFHGTTVAILQQNGMWSMFFFGFATMFIVTQMYGLPIPKGLRRALTVFYGLFALFTYSGLYFDKSIVMLHQVTWIPIILYGLVFVITYLAALWPDKKTV